MLRSRLPEFIATILHDLLHEPQGELLNKPCIKLPNSSEYSITDSTSKKNEDIYRLHNFRNNTMQI